MRSQNMWFWFFEARNSPSTAPLALWLNGGPGCSSMIGLFQENGPCTFNNVSGSTPVLNPNSWNNYANMLYVDQPIGTGFSLRHRRRDLDGHRCTVCVEASAGILRPIPHLREPQFRSVH
jgi:carboxypeptidase C (cathepsin A)